MQRRVKFQFEMPKENADRLEELAEQGRVTKKEIISNALTLFEWAIEEVQRGRIIASVDEEGERYKEIVLPLLKLFDVLAKARHTESATAARMREEEVGALLAPGEHFQPMPSGGPEEPPDEPQISDLQPRST